jgi:nickel transport protein
MEHHFTWCAQSAVARRAAWSAALSAAPSRALVVARVLALTAALSFAGSAAAHTATIELDGAPTRFAVRFWGHAGKTEPYEADKVQRVTALDANGRPIAVTRHTGADGAVRATVAAQPALVALEFDNGIWSRAEGGKSVNRPMNEVPDATRGTHAPKYAKTVVAWNDVAQRPLGQPLEIVPLSATAPRAGQPIRVRVLFEGRPLGGAKVAADEDAPAALTDGDGVANYTPRRGRNTVWVNHRVDVAGDARMTQRSHEAVLVFEAQ